MISIMWMNLIQSSLKIGRKEWSPLSKRILQQTVLGRNCRIGSPGSPSWGCTLWTWLLPESCDTIFIISFYIHQHPVGSVSLENPGKCRHKLMLSSNKFCWHPGGRLLVYHSLSVWSLYLQGLIHHHQTSSKSRASQGTFLLPSGPKPHPLQ